MLEQYPLITADQHWLLAAICAGLVASAIWAERMNWAQTLSAPLLIMLGGMILANSGVIPNKAPVYSGIGAYLMPVAIPLLLLRADLRRVLRDTGPMLAAFAVAVTATVAGALLAPLFVDLGHDEAEITATMAASLIGGSLNFVATAETLGFNEPSRYVAALSADVLGAVIFLMLLTLLPLSAYLRNKLPSAYFDPQGRPVDPATKVDESDTEAGEFHLQGLSLALGISIAVCALSVWLCDWLNMPSLKLLLITTITLIIANAFPGLQKHIHGEFVLGAFLMYAFFVTIGAGAQLVTVLESALPMLGLVSIILCVHLVLLLVLGRLFKLGLAELMIASNACIIGPATAIGLASSRGWTSLATPGMLVGVLGYAIGTFIGVALFQVL